MYLRDAAQVAKYVALRAAAVCGASVHISLCACMRDTALFLHPGSPADIDQYVSVCAMCSHNEAAVRWIRAEKDHISFRFFRIRYECYDAQGDVLIPKDVSNIIIYFCSQKHHC